MQKWLSNEAMRPIRLERRVSREPQPGQLVSMLILTPR
jgi:hypothetical protein